MCDIKVRAYNQSDKQKFLEIYDAAMIPAHDFLAEDIRLPQRQLAESLLDDPETETFVLENDGQAVGFASILNSTVMVGFFIDSELQGQGLGRYLMENIQSNRKIINLVVYALNGKAIRFYERNGFCQTGEHEDSPGQRYFEMTWKAT